jgi:uncharacterized membrane protein
MIVLRVFGIIATTVAIAIMWMLSTSIWDLARADTSSSTVVTVTVLPYLSVDLQTGEVHSNYPVAATTSYLTVDGVVYRITSVL